MIEKTEERFDERSRKYKIEDLPVFHCSCGARILIIPDVGIMNKAVKNHIIMHERNTGEHLSEGAIVESILRTISSHLSSKKRTTSHRRIR